MNILIIHTAFIGDIVLATPLISKIADKYKNSNIYFLTTPLGEQILKNNPNIKEIIVYDKKNKDKGLKNFFKLLRKIRSLNLHLCLCPHRYLRSSILMLLSGSSVKIGYDIAPLSIFFDKKIKYDKNKHEVEKLLSFLDIDDENLRYEVNLYPSEKDILKINSLLKDKKNKKIITIAPGSKWFTKKWPEEYFDTLIKNLSSQQELFIIIVGGEEEKNIKLNLNENCLDLRGKTSLLELAELIKNSSIVITNDSSPVHIASAFSETKIFAIFGPTTKEFGFFPWSKNNIVFEINNLDCRPCSIHGGNTCPKKHFKCMKDIKVEIIEKEIKKYLNLK